MRNIARNGILTLFLIFIAAWAVMPHDWLPAGFPRIGKVSKGKDLAGGVSLVYAVDVRPGEQRDVIPRVIDVLKDRIDPTGQLEIGIVQQGNDRIEITMPLPTERVKRLRQNVEDILAELERGWVSPDEFERILRLPADERDAAIARMSGDDQTRRALIAAAAEAHDAAAAARAAYDAQRDRVAAAQAQLDEMLALPPEQQNQPVIDLLRQALAEEERKLDEPAARAASANIAYAQAREKVLSATISPAEVRRALRLSDRPVSLRDRRSNKFVQLPSPRERALTRLKESHPAAAPIIDRAVAAWETYERERSTLDDPADLKRILQGAGVLHFRITANPGELPDEMQLRERLREVGPRNAGSEQVAWYKINKIDNWYNDVAELEALSQNPVAYFAGRGYVVEEWDGEYWMLAYRAPGMQLTEQEGDWSLASAFQGVDELGRPAINFTMDTLGAQRLGRLTERNVGRQMAILLDDEVYTAPNLRSRIANSGQITGSFSPEEIRYIVRVLSAGSLQAKLSPEPISESILAPELGQENLNKALQAGVFCFLLCAAFLAGYYFRLGLIAVVGLVVNALLLVGAMSLQHAPFSVPGIAGVILAFAMAVDANVLIYERMREEMLAGADLRTAVRLGYQKALSAIVDGNLTNLIVAAVLGLVGTQEIKGFAIAMSVGVLTTLFSQLVVTRLLFDIFIEKFGWRRASMLPIAVPAVQRAFTLNVDWLAKRGFFYAVSTLVVVLGLVMVAVRGKDMLDNEFLGGTAVTIQLKADDGTGKPVKLPRSEVERRIREVAESRRGTAIAELAKADVIAVNPDPNNIDSNQFTIKTVVADAETVKDAVIEALGDAIDSQPQLQFAGADAERPIDAPVFPILGPALGDSIDRPQIRNDVSAFIGGAAILLEDLQPRPTLASLEARLAQVRGQPDFADTAGRRTSIVIIDGVPEAVRTAVVLVRDPNVSYFADEFRWASSLRDREWNLLTSALSQRTTLASVQSFSPAIARTFAAQAMVAIVLSVLLVVIYVWVRFNSLRFSIAAIVATGHDVLAAVGLIALAEIVFDAAPGFSRAVGLLPFTIDLQMVAALLTVLGYSINDKIVILDRIRENRGKLPYATRDLINLSINQTLSRTIMTGTTTILSTLVLYLIGGEGIRGFAYALGLGIIIGTYSSVALGAPLVWSKKVEGGSTPPGAEGARTAGAAAAGPGGNGVASLPAAAGR